MGSAHKFHCICFSPVLILFSNLLRNNKLYLQIVCIQHDEVWKRAIVISVLPTCQASCWLLDYADICTTDKVYDLALELKEIEPIAKRASFYNIVARKMVSKIFT